MCRRPLPDPFIVVATQNPIEYEGTYPLPEAQLDRFLAKLDVGYPTADDEAAVLRLAHEGVAPATLDDVQAVTSPAELVEARADVDATTVSEEVIGYVVALVRKTRELPSVALGASPRGAVHLLAAAKAAARLAGRELRDARRRRGGRARGAAAPAAAAARGRARALHRRRRGRDRHFHGARAAMSPSPWAALALLGAGFAALLVPAPIAAAIAIAVVVATVVDMLLARVGVLGCGAGSQRRSRAACRRR